jgi:hypothetical protein
MWPLKEESLAKGASIFDPSSWGGRGTANGTVPDWGSIAGEVRASELEAGRHEESGSLEGQQAESVASVRTGGSDLVGPESRSFR